MTVVPVGNKIVVAERQIIKKNSHDFQAIDVFESVGDFAYDISNVMELLKERGIDYGKEQIRNAILGYARIIGQEESTRRFDKHNMRYGSSTSGRESKIRENDNRNDSNVETRLNGATNDTSSEQNLQKASSNVEAEEKSPAFYIATIVKKITIYNLIFIRGNAVIII